MTKADCDACKGLWARHGLAETKSCICRMKDAGKVCHDGSDCAGACLADEKKFQVKDPGPPPRGFYVGKCSTYDTVFGCYKFIPEGIRKKGPQTKEEAAEALCVD